MERTLEEQQGFDATFQRNASWCFVHSPTVNATRQRVVLSTNLRKEIGRRANFTRRFHASLEHAADVPLAAISSALATMFSVLVNTPEKETQTLTNKRLAYNFAFSSEASLPPREVGQNLAEQNIKVNRSQAHRTASTRPTMLQSQIGQKRVFVYLARIH